MENQVQICNTGLLQLTKLNRGRGLASAWLEPTVQRQLPEAHSKGLYSDLSKPDLRWECCFNASRQQWYQGTLAV